MGTPVPGKTPGSTKTPTICNTEPTLLLVVIVAGVFHLATAIVVAFIATRRWPSSPMLGARIAPAGMDVPVVVPAPEPTTPPRRNAPPDVRSDGNPRGRNWRDVYVRFLSFVDKAMSDVARTMPDEGSMPVQPLLIQREESGTLAAELTVLGSSSVHEAHAAWSQALFQFYLLARDVAHAGSQNLPEEQ
jgi:hypothetical protein